VPKILQTLISNSKNVLHQLPHRFLVALWGFPSPKGNASKLGFNFDGIISLVPKKSVKLSKLVFFFYSWPY